MTKNKEERKREREGGGGGGGGGRVMETSIRPTPQKRRKGGKLVPVTGFNLLVSEAVTPPRQTSDMIVNCRGGRERTND